MFVSRFNNKFWSALKLIPRGKVTTYKAIAEFIGHGGAARAVGNACNKNPNAPKVPCHRVVKSDWTLGGYAGGIKKKTQLLKKEGVKAVNGRIHNIEDKKFIFK